MARHRSSAADWERLAVEHGAGRTARECHDRWTWYLKPGSRKGQWREEEGAVVLRAIFANGRTADGGDAAAGGGQSAHPPFTQ